jgi:hypothetical protein
VQEGNIPESDYREEIIYRLMCSGFSESVGHYALLVVIRESRASAWSRSNKKLIVSD